MEEPKSDNIDLLTNMHPSVESMPSPPSSELPGLDANGYGASTNDCLSGQEDTRAVRPPHPIHNSPLPHYNIVPAHRRAELLSQQAARAAVAAGIERDLACASGKTATPEKTSFSPMTLPYSYQVE